MEIFPSIEKIHPSRVWVQPCGVALSRHHRAARLRGSSSHNTTGRPRRGQLMHICRSNNNTNTTTSLQLATTSFCLKDNAHFAPSAVRRVRMSKGLGAILSTGDSRSANSAGAAECSWSGACWGCPSMLLNNCVPSAKDLRFDWCQSVARGSQDGFCQMGWPHCLAGWYYGFSGR
jgi:hypothetical protein